MASKEILKEGLYFVHYIGTDKESDHRRMVLTKESMESPCAVRGYEVDADEMVLENGVSEGNFACFDGEKLISAENDPTAMMYAEINRQLTEDINLRNYGNKPKELSGRITDVCSYHIYIGNEGCCIIAFREDGKGTAFMVDCTSFDFMEGRDYSDNLEACLQQVKADFQIDKISKLLITHLHYDHISGIEYLIRKGWLDQDTEVWMNTRYPWKSAAYSRILARLCALGVRFIEPLADNSTEQIQVLYPAVRFDENNKAPGESIHNASVLYQIFLEEKRMLFLGDIGKEGFEQVFFDRQFFDYPLYVCVSHHGDIAKQTEDINILGGQDFIRKVGNGVRARYALLIEKSPGRSDEEVGAINRKFVWKIGAKREEIIERRENEKFLKLEW